MNRREFTKAAGALGVASALSPLNVAAQQQKLKVGVILPRSGYLGLIGQSCQMGADIAPALIKVPFDPTKDLAPIAQVGEGVISMVVSPSLGVKNAAELIALGKSRANGLTYASSGIGSLGHLAGELVGLIGSVPLTHVPFQGAAQAVTSVVTGEVAIGFPPITQVAPLARSGDLSRFIL